MRRPWRTDARPAVDHGQIASLKAEPETTMAQALIRQLALRKDPPVKTHHSCTCAYCENPATTDDHIPPQSLLLGVPKSKRPKVPSCEACNTGASDDDEHVRNLIVMHHSVSDTPQARAPLDKFYRSINNPHKIPYLADINRRIVEVEVSSFKGIPLGRQPGYSVETARFQKTYERYIKGLHFIEFGALKNNRLEARILLDPEKLRHELESVEEHMSGGVLKEINQKVFWYKHKRLSDELSTTFWLTCHFGNFLVLARTRSYSADVSGEKKASIQIQRTEA